MPNRHNGPSTYTTMMRLTASGRPFARDLHDIFAALMLQLKLGNHRSLFRTYPQSFTTEEAAERLNDLGVTHIIRHQDPDDPTKQVATKATTRFSMSREMAKGLMQHFLNAQLMESSTDSGRQVKDRGIYFITHKGKVMIIEFGGRAMVSVAPLKELLAKIDPLSIVTLERLPSSDDMLALTRANLLVALRTMIRSLPMEALLLDDVGGLECKDVREYKQTFYGYQCFDWICSYLTVVSRQEADLVACEFILHGWIEHVLDKSDRTHPARQGPSGITFHTSRNAIYHLTAKGRAALDEDASSRSRDTSLNNDPGTPTLKRRDSALGGGTGSARESFDSARAATRRSMPAGIEKDWQWTQLQEIIADPLQRMCFREFLKTKFCEENLNFHLDYVHLQKKKSASSPSSSSHKSKSRLTDCYAIYDKYLAPGAAMELNIEHTLRQSIVQYVSCSFSVISSDNTTDLPFFSPSTDPQQQSHVVVVILSGNIAQCFKTLMGLYEEVNQHVCSLMAQDSMPSFVKTDKYKDLLAHQLGQARRHIEGDSDDPFLYDSDEYNSDAFNSDDYEKDEDHSSEDATDNDNHVDSIANDLGQLQLDSTSLHVVPDS